MQTHFPDYRYFHELELNLLTRKQRNTESVQEFVVTVIYDWKLVNPKITDRELTFRLQNAIRPEYIKSFIESEPKTISQALHRLIVIQKAYHAEKTAHIKILTRDIITNTLKVPSRLANAPKQYTYVNRMVHKFSPRNKPQFSFTNKVKNNNKLPHVTMKVFGQRTHALIDNGSQLTILCRDLIPHRFRIADRLKSYVTV